MHLFCVLVFLVSTSCFAELAWAVELSAFGWQGTTCRLSELCGMLVSNGLHHWTQLDFVPALSALAGAKSFTDAELLILFEMQNRGRDAPRLVN